MILKQRDSKDIDHKIFSNHLTLKQSELVISIRRILTLKGSNIIHNHSILEQRGWRISFSASGGRWTTATATMVVAVWTPMSLMSTAMVIIFMNYLCNIMIFCSWIRFVLIRISRFSFRGETLHISVCLDFLVRFTFWFSSKNKSVQGEIFKYAFSRKSNCQHCIDKKILTNRNVKSFHLWTNNYKNS